MEEGWGGGGGAEGRGPNIDWCRYIKFSVCLHYRIGSLRAVANNEKGERGEKGGGKGVGEKGERGEKGGKEGGEEGGFSPYCLHDQTGNYVEYLWDYLFVLRIVGLKILKFSLETSLKRLKIIFL